MRRALPATRGLFAGQGSPGFGPSAYAPPPGPAPAQRIRGRRPGVLRAALRAECPRQSGVYGMVDANGELIYVGKAKCLRTRLASYFRPRSREPKAGRILQHTRSILWEVAPGEFAALLRELELIRRWRPRFNVQGMPGRRGRAFVCLGRRPAPHLFVAPRPPAGVLAAFGPVSAGRLTREGVRCVNDWFRLRDCPRQQQMVFADQAELFATDRTAGCLRYEIGTCLGPCAAACTRAAYNSQARSARAFLEGRDLTPLETTERQMAQASAALAYERAAALRDRLESLRWLHDQLARLRLAREMGPCVYPAEEAAGTLWYVLRHGRVSAVVAAPHNAATRRVAAAAIRRVFHGPACDTGPAEDVEVLLMVSAWFRRHPDERARLLDVPAALRRCLSPE